VESVRRLAQAFSNMAVSLRVTGTWAELTADGAVAIPSTPQAGDRMYLFARWKDFSITAQVTSPAGWTELDEFADGSVTSGNGTGSVKVGCWYRDWQSGDTNPTLDFSSSPTNASVVIMVMAKGSGDTWDTPIARTAAMTNWTTSSQTVSASASVVVPSGSVVMGLIGIRDDTATMTRPTTGIDDSTGAITWNGDYVESPATHHSTTTGDDGAADLGYRLVTTGATATLRMTGTISAAETGAALWVVQSVSVVVTPDNASLTLSSFAPAFGLGLIPATASLILSTFAPALNTSVVPPTATLSTTSFAAVLNLDVIPATSSLALTAFAPSIGSGVVPTTQTLTTTSFAPSLSLAIIPPSTVLTLSTFAPRIPGLPAKLTFLDPGGDAVQAVEYFATSGGGSGSAPAFDTSQKVVGVGSYKFDSGASNGASYNKAVGVLPAGSGRISCYFRYDDIPDTAGSINQNPDDDTEYSGGGFSGAATMYFNDGDHATATPPKNDGQGSTFGFFLEGTIPDTAIIDSVKIVYERSYSVNTSIGISRVRWVVNEEEGPNHDNTDTPLSDTVVEVDVTSERTWEIADLNSFQVIAEARRGDTDTEHTQLWDYIAVVVEYHLSASILWGQHAATGFHVLRLDALPVSSGIVIRYVDSDGGTTSFFDGITVLPPNEYHRVGLSYVINGANDVDVNVYIDGVEELSLTGRNTFGQTSGPDLLYGWIGQPGADRLCWFDQVYVDDGDDLGNPGPILMTAKLPASVNTNNFDTTGGTGAVNERPVNLANYKQQTGISEVDQDYTLEADSSGDIDISGEVIVGNMGWAIAKRGTSGNLGLLIDGVSQTISATTTPAFYHKGASDPDYPSTVGLRSSGDSDDSFLYECGSVVAYQGPAEDILFARYLLLAENSAEVVDDLSIILPETYTLRYWVGAGGGTVLFRVYSILSEGSSPQIQTVFQSSGGTGVEFVGAPGIEVRIVMEVSDADTYVMLQHYFDL
jgi:hypothetical protein